MKLDKSTRRQLIDLYNDKKISLEGNILKIIDVDDDPEFRKYIDESIENDKNNRRKRLDVTKQVQLQNAELIKSEKENDRINRQLAKALQEAEILKNEAIKSRDDEQLARLEAERAKDDAEKARSLAENAKKVAENDLELIQKKSQFELIGVIVKIALSVIIGVGLITTLMYGVALYTGLDTTVIGSTWSNIIGILLTNAFSIVGTIMGVKYASEKN